MKRYSLLYAGAIVALFGAVLSPAQQAQRINYRTSVYLNVAPEKTAAFLEQVRGPGRKLMQERIASGENITLWTISRLAYRGEPADSYNYVVSTVYDGAPQTANPARREEIYKRATGMSFQDYNLKNATLATNVGSRLFRVEGSAQGGSVKEGSYSNVTQWKISTGRGADYGNYVQNMLVPLNTQAVKDGVATAWMALRVVSPGGPSAPYDAIIINTVKDQAAALPTTPANPDAAQTRFMQVFPRMSFSNFVDQGQALRTLVGTRMFETMVVVERNGSGGTLPSSAAR